MLVNNAGVIAVKPIEETEPAEWDRIVRTNLRGPYLYCRAFVPSMKLRNEGTIINVTSMSGVMGFVGEAAYCPSKFGLEGLTQTLALELAPWRIRVCSVHPGVAMRTPMSMTTYDDAAKRDWVDPAEIAPGFARLAATTGQTSPAAGSTSGRSRKREWLEQSDRERRPDGGRGVSRFGFVGGRTSAGDPGRPRRHDHQLLRAQADPGRPDGRSCSARTGRRRGPSSCATTSG